MTFIAPFAAAWVTPLFSGLLVAGGIFTWACKMDGPGKEMFIVIGGIAVVVTAFLIVTHLLSSGTTLGLIGGVGFAFLIVWYLKSGGS